MYIINMLTLLVNLYNLGQITSNVFNSTETYKEHHYLTPFNPCLIFEVGFIITTRVLHDRGHIKRIYLGSVFTSDGRCEKDVKRRIGIAKTTNVHIYEKSVVREKHQYSGSTESTEILYLVNYTIRM